MAELEFIRHPDDRRCLEAAGLGRFRLEGWSKRSAAAQARDGTWTFRRTGVWTRASTAVDSAGTVVGEFTSRRIGRGGTLRWSGRDYALAPDSFWKQRYAIADGGTVLATIEAKGRGRRPVRLSIDDLDAVPAGLLLFAAFVVRALAEHASSSASAVSSTS